MREAPVRLRCEYQELPLAVDSVRPRLSWWLNDSRAAELQTAYQIQAASSATGLQAGTADLWDTGYVSSRQTVNVEYRGPALEPGDRVWWRVRCYDSDGTPSPWSAAARFELGPADAQGWQAQWIGSPLIGSPTTAVPVPALWRDFELLRQPLAARLHVAVLGSARLELNGTPVLAAAAVGGASIAQGRVAYHTFDVTELLRTGANRLGALLADGDYCGHLADGQRQRHGERPWLCLQLSVELGNGARFTLASDAAWRWRPSWILRADRDRGEEVDARQYRADWSLPGGEVEAYPVVVEPAIDVLRVAARGARAAVLAEHAGARLLQRKRTSNGHIRLRYDFGRELVGHVRLVLRADRATTLRVSHGLGVPSHCPDGAEHPEIRWETGADRYTCRGGEAETFEPGFAVHAFRYVDIDIDREPQEVIWVGALELGAGAEAVAGLQCDQPLLQRYFAAAARACRWGLLLGPVAGLAPDQRRPAGADLMAVVAGAAACLDVAATCGDWLGGMVLHSQAASDPAGTAEDAGSLLTGLWFCYRSYGDRRLLEQAYPTVQHHLRHSGERWLRNRQDNQAQAVPLGEQMLALAWYAYELTLASRMAGVLGRLADLEAVEARAEDVRRAFRARYVSADGLLVSDDQLGYLLALEIGVLDEAARATALQRLEAQLRRDGFHSTVDVRHGSLLLEVLTLEGRLDLAYQVLLQIAAPGCLSPLDAGAELLWDTVTGVPGRLAGAVLASWLQRFLLGLELDDNLTPELNAYRRMRIQPRPPLGHAFAAGPPVRRASGYLDTVHGRYESAWQIDDDTFRLTVRVPGNCSARVVLPDGSERLVMAGRHEFALPHEPAVAPAQAEQIPVLREISGGR